jgi:mRNA-degrading endonuclease RelE of RelBE toxin-antitoxin system
MDKISKALKKLSAKEKIKVKILLEKILSGNFSNVDIKKLKGRDDIYRIRQGKLRIIFCNRETVIAILTIERRSDQTYNGK